MMAYLASRELLRHWIRKRQIDCNTPCYHNQTVGIILKPPTWSSTDSFKAYHDHDTLAAKLGELRVDLRFTNWLKN